MSHLKVPLDDYEAWMKAHDVPLSWRVKKGLEEARIAYAQKLYREVESHLVVLERPHVVYNCMCAILVL